LWHPQQQQQNNNPNKTNANKKNKQKKKNNAAAKKTKEIDLSKRLEKQGDENGEEGEENGDTADVVIEGVSKIDLSDEAENKDLKQEA
jgi:hypothetical protein